MFYKLIYIFALLAFKSVIKPRGFEDFLGMFRSINV